ncbi:MAG: ABC transporter permease [Deltaproteobacteria bacterium]|nr:ABC transporter permease [Deltaproteobacteria bacterium]
MIAKSRQRLLLRLLIRRLLLACVSLTGIGLLSFALIHLTPGEASLGADSELSAGQIAQRRRLYFLDLPVFYNSRPQGAEQRAARVLHLAHRETPEARRAVSACGTVCLPELFRAAQRDPAMRWALEQLKPTDVATSAEQWADRLVGRLSPAQISQSVERALLDPQRLAEIERLGSAALPALIDALLRAHGPVRVRISQLASRLSGFTQPLRGDAADRRRLANWRAWWFQHQRDYQRFPVDSPWLLRVSETRFGKWIARLIRWDFGFSLRDGRPVTEKIGQALPVTLLLAGLALIVAFGLGVPLGLVAAQREGRWADRLLSGGSLLLYALPTFWVAMLLVQLFGGLGLLDWLPISGLVSDDLAATASFWQRFLDRLLHLILPVFCMSYALLAAVLRYQRQAVLEVRSALYVRAARARGLSERRVVWGHLLRNALLPTITLFGLYLPYLVGGSVVVERIFNIPGMGLLTFESMLARDYPVLMGLILISAVVVVVGMLIADLLYALADPRVAAALDRQAFGAANRRGLR